MLHGVRFARRSRPGKGGGHRWTVILALGAALATGPAAAAGPRVVSINLCADQLLVPLADPDQVIGLSPFARDAQRSGIAADATRFRILSGTAEEVLALRPDIVLAGRFTKRTTRELLRQQGLRVVELDAVRSLDEARAQIRQVAELVGHPDRGEVALGEIAAAADRARLAGAARRMSVLPLQRRGWVSGAGTLLGGLLDLVGLTSAGSRGIGRFMSLEAVVALRPDLLLLTEGARGPEDQGSALLQHDALLRLYPPEKRIVLPDSLNLLCGGPALASALDRLAEAVARAR